MAEKVTIPYLLNLKHERKPIVSTTVYDYQMARIVDRAGVDLILVGDSGGRVLLGHREFSDCTMDEMMLMTRSVTRGTKHAFVVGDLPFMSYQINIEEAIRNAGRFIQEAGADGVKLEGGERFAPTVAAIVNAGIPVLGHIGATPLTTMGMGAWIPIQEVTKLPEMDERAILRDAHAIQDAGAFGTVLTRIPPPIAARITKELDIFTLGPHNTNGRLTGVTNLLGVDADQIDKPTSRYGPIARIAYDAVCEYVADTRAGKVSQPVG
jgi:3-methyl-2-oxobutanoate hydroxymethyltransferase